MQWGLGVGLMVAWLHPQSRIIALRSCNRMKRGNVAVLERRAPFSRGWLWSLGLMCLLQVTFADSQLGNLASVAPTKAKPTFTDSGVASYYADKFHGRMTANGETFDMNALTAAHRTLPFGTKLKVTSIASSRSVVVRINDRGPYAKGRVIDLSLAAAKELQMVRSGVAEVKLEILK